MSKKKGLKGYFDLIPSHDLIHDTYELMLIKLYQEYDPNLSPKEESKRLKNFDSLARDKYLDRYKWYCKVRQSWKKYKLKRKIK